MKVLPVFMLIDYLISYYTISYLGVCIEANPRQVWLFELPLQVGLPIRIAMITTVMLAIYWLYKENKKITLLIVDFGLFANMIILMQHFTILKYFNLI